MKKTLVTRITPQGVKKFWKIEIPLISDFAATLREGQKVKP